MVEVEILWLGFEEWLRFEVGEKTRIVVSHSKSYLKKELHTESHN